MVRPLLLSIFLAVAGFSLYAQQAQQAEKPKADPAPMPFVVPEEAAKKANPTKADERSVAEGLRLYDTECAFCHGKDGAGKTELAESMKLNLPDLREPATTKGRTDGALFYIIQKGKGKMPHEEGRLRDAQVWHVVNYLRSIIKKEAEPEKSEKK